MGLVRRVIASADGNRRGREIGKVTVADRVAMATAGEGHGVGADVGEGASSQSDIPGSRELQPGSQEASSSSQFVRDSIIEVRRM